MIKIGDFSKLSRVSIRMLRYYNDIGLLVPVSVDDFTGYRYYSAHQLPVVNRITALRDMGFSLTEVCELISCYEDAEKVRSYLERRKAQTELEAEEMKKRLLMLENALRQVGKDDSAMKYDVVLKEMPGRYVASVRKVIPAYNQEGILWGILGQESARLGIVADDPSYGLAIFHDGEYKEKDVDVELQIAVKGRYEDTDQVVFKQVEPLQIASCTYKGSYDKITTVNEAVVEWIQSNGYEFDGLNFCIYHVSPGVTNDPEELVTEVCYPVKKK